MQQVTVPLRSRKMHSFLRRNSTAKQDGVTSSSPTIKNSALRKDVSTIAEPLESTNSGYLKKSSGTNMFPHGSTGRVFMKSPPINMACLALRKSKGSKKIRPHTCKLLKSVDTECQHLVPLHQSPSLHTSRIQGLPRDDSSLSIQHKENFASFRKKAIPTYLLNEIHSSNLKPVTTGSSLIDNGNRHSLQEHNHSSHLSMNGSVRRRESMRRGDANNLKMPNEEWLQMYEALIGHRRISNNVYRQTLHSFTNHTESEDFANTMPNSSHVNTQAEINTDCYDAEPQVDYTSLDDDKKLRAECEVDLDAAEQQIRMLDKEMIELMNEAYLEDQGACCSGHNLEEISKPIDSIGEDATVIFKNTNFPKQHSEHNLLSMIDQLFSEIDYGYDIK